MPEKLIQQRSGHLSLHGLQQYQRTTLEQEKAVSGVLASNVSYQQRHMSVLTETQPQWTPDASSHMQFSGCSHTIYNGYPPPCQPQAATVSVHTVSEEH